MLFIQVFFVCGVFPLTKPLKRETCVFCDVIRENKIPRGEKKQNKKAEHVSCSILVFYTHRHKQPHVIAIRDAAGGPVLLIFDFFFFKEKKEKRKESS